MRNVVDDLGDRTADVTSSADIVPVNYAIMNQMMHRSEITKNISRAFYVCKGSDSMGSPYANGAIMLIGEADTFNAAKGIVLRNGSGTIYRTADDSEWDDFAGWL